MEGCGAVGELKDWMKSTIVERWMGVKRPYQMRLTVTVPFKRSPLWYFRTRGCCLTRAEKEGLVRDRKRRRRVARREVKAMIMGEGFESSPV